jgi:hypothetical protein
MKILTIHERPQPRSFCRRRVAPMNRCSDQCDEQFSFEVVRRAR